MHVYVGFFFGGKQVLSGYISLLILPTCSPSNKVIKVLQTTLVSLWLPYYRYLCVVIIGCHFALFECSYPTVVARQLLEYGGEQRLCLFIITVVIHMSSRVKSKRLIQFRYLLSLVVEITFWCSFRGFVGLNCLRHFVYIIWGVSKAVIIN